MNLKKDNEDEYIPVEFPLDKDWKTKLKQKWRKLNKALRVFNFIMMTLMISTVFLFPYPDPFQAINGMEEYKENPDQRKLVISQEDRETVFNNYDGELEEGFCVFGTHNNSHVKVEEIIHNKDPMLQKEKVIGNTCVNQIKNQLPELYTDYNYKFLGSIHTHPQSDIPRPSDRDLHSMGVRSLITEINGVASSNMINFYSHENVYQAMPVSYIKKG